MELHLFTNHAFSFTLPSLMLPFHHRFITHNMKEKKKTKNEGNETAKDDDLKFIQRT